MILRQNRNNRRVIASEDFFFIFLLEDTLIWNNIYPAEAHKLKRFQKGGPQEWRSLDHPALEKRHNILGVHANLLQCPKGTDQLKVWEALL